MPEENSYILLLERYQKGLQLLEENDSQALGKIFSLVSEFKPIVKTKEERGLLKKALSILMAENERDYQEALEQVGKPGISVDDLDDHMDSLSRGHSWYAQDWNELEGMDLMGKAVYYSQERFKVIARQGKEIIVLETEPCLNPSEAIPWRETSYYFSLIKIGQGEIFYFPCGEKHGIFYLMCPKKLTRPFAAPAGQTDFALTKRPELKARVEKLFQDYYQKLEIAKHQQEWLRLRAQGKLSGEEDLFKPLEERI